MTPEKNPVSGGKARGGPHPSVLRSAVVVGFFTLLSRVFGFLRDMVVANYFGARSAADAFFVAFRIPNMFRQLTAEGALSAAFVPLFTKTMMEDREKAMRFANNLLVTLTVALTGAVVVMIIFSPLLLKVIAIGFTGDAAKFDLTVNLTRLLFPYLIFISLAAVFMGMLNSFHHFSSPAASPVLLNLAIIVCTIFLRGYFSLPVYALVVGVLLGGLLQLAVQVPFAIREGFVFRPVFDPGSRLIRRVVTLSIPATFGIAVAEVNLLVDTMLASLLGEGAVSYLYYAQRLVQFPMGVFGVAMSTALLPTLSRQSSGGQAGKMVETVSESFRITMFLIIPSMVGLFALREPIVRLIYEHGEFTRLHTANTAFTLAFFTLGLLSFSGVKIFVSAFYAMGDTKTPVKIAALAMALNVALNLILMWPLKQAGLALATSMSSTINMALLAWLLRKRLGRLDGRRIFKSFKGITFSALVMAGVIYGAWGPLFGGGYTVAGLLAMLAIAGFSYFVAAFALRLEETSRLYDGFKRRFSGW
ncbi:MAG: murein biosynthesis integral membrane protein MurJ [Nitrospinae bacterium]|nr:murein biosynthesis integral membrane protein MurJ [Nitrospinota bacterium]